MATTIPLKRSLSATQLEEESKAKDVLDSILSFSSSTKEVFIDPDFPPNDASLGDVNYTYKTATGGLASMKLTWKRPKDMRRSGESGPWRLLSDSPHPNDIRQGTLGDCWLLSALAVVAEKPSLLRRLFVTHTYDERIGVFQVRLCINGEWRVITVDDHFPTGVNDTFAFSSAANRQLWVQVLEKAVAKAMGSFKAIESGNIKEGLRLFTGLPIRETTISRATEDAVVEATVESMYASGYLLGASCGIEADSSSDVPPELLSSLGDVSATIEEDFRALGLSPEHAYSLLRMERLENGTLLLQLRNPWSRTSWSGDYGPNSKKWTKALRERLDYTNPKEQQERGLFWLCWRDFCYYFRTVEAAKYRVGATEYRCAIDSSWALPVAAPASAEVQVLELQPLARGELEVVVAQPYRRTFLYQKKRSEAGSSGIGGGGGGGGEGMFEEVLKALGIDGGVEGGVADGPDLPQLVPMAVSVVQMKATTNTFEADAEAKATELNGCETLVTDPQVYTIVPSFTSNSCKPNTRAIIEIHSAIPFLARPITIPLSKAVRLQLDRVKRYGTKSNTLICTAYTLSSDSMIMMVVQNPHATFSLEFDATFSNLRNLKSSRHELSASASECRVVDILPPRTEKIVVAFTKHMNGEGYSWSASFSYRQCRDEVASTPPTASSGLHELFFICDDN